MARMTKAKCCKQFCGAVGGKAGKLGAKSERSNSSKSKQLANKLMMAQLGTMSRANEELAALQSPDQLD